MMLDHVPATDINWFQQCLIKWGLDNYVEYPWRICTSSIHQILVEILLQRTKAAQVVPVFQKLIIDYPTITNLATLSESKIQEIIYPLGLHWRAAHIRKLIQIIKDQYDGYVPDTIEQLRRLPGVGDYVSQAYLSLHLNKRAPIIDSNVVRIYGRFFGFSYNGETRRKKWLKVFANRLTPEENFRGFNYALLDFANALCKRSPDCESCPLNSRCTFATQ